MDYKSIVWLFLEKNTASIENDQFFLIDPAVIDRLIEVADLTKNDHVLEVGTGLGFLTKALAEKAGRVTTIEIDPRFHSFHADVPSNVEVIHGDAYRLLNDRNFQLSHKSPTKTVSSIPYSQAQNMLHNYTNWDWYQGDVVWLAPISLAEKINKEPILGAYFHAEVILEVSKESFLPQPNTKSAIIYFHRIENPMKSKNADIYFRRWLYNHEDMKMKNAVKEGIIHLASDLYGKVVTKKQSETIMSQLAIPKDDLEKMTNNITHDYYFTLAPKIATSLKGQ